MKVMAQDKIVTNGSKVFQETDTNGLKLTIFHQIGLKLAAVCLKVRSWVHFFPYNWLNANKFALILDKTVQMDLSYQRVNIGHEFLMSDALIKKR